MNIYTGGRSRAVSGIFNQVLNSEIAFEEIIVGKNFRLGNSEFDL